MINTSLAGCDELMTIFIRDVRQGKKSKASLYRSYTLRITRKNMTGTEYKKGIDQFYEKIMDLNNSEESLIPDVKTWGKLHR